ncbi:Arc family DNA-binding protein [Enterococcus faecalis]
MATYKNPHFAIRIPKELLEKLKYIAEYNARSANKEIEFLVRTHVNNFEKEHGKIKVNGDKK